MSPVHGEDFDQDDPLYASGKRESGTSWTVRRGDSKEVGSTLAPSSINCVVTSPPYYWQRDYRSTASLGFSPPSMAIDNLRETFAAIKPGSPTMASSSSTSATPTTARKAAPTARTISTAPSLPRPPRGGRPRARAPSRGVDQVPVARQAGDAGGRGPCERHDLGAEVAIPSRRARIVPGASTSTSSCSPSRLAISSTARASMVKRTCGSSSQIAGRSPAARTSLHTRAHWWSAHRGRLPGGRNRPRSVRGRWDHHVRRRRDGAVIGGDRAQP